MTRNLFLKSFATGLLAAVLPTSLQVHAQEVLQTNMSGIWLADTAATHNQAQSSRQTGSGNAASSSESNWHVVVSPYIWLPGVHGTAGTPNATMSIHASPGDLLSNFRFGLMGLADASYKRVVLPIDLMWVRLADSKALPFPNLAATTADFKASEFILTPGIGYRVVNHEKLKLDALTGFRYWHFSESVQFSPSLLGLKLSQSRDWVDPLVGGRIVATLAPKAEMTISGDVGGWGVGSQLDYQIVGLLGYKIKPKWTLQAGYRYLDVDYHNGVIFHAATSGVLFGVSIKLK